MTRNGQKRRQAAPAPTRAPVAVGYIRVSTEEQSREGVSLDAQMERVTAYCTLRGLELRAVYRDEGVSAGKPLSQRPEGSALLEAVRAGDVTHVVSLKLDRLFRNAIDCLSTAQEWDDAGVALHLVDLGGQAVDTTSAMGRFFLTVMAAAAEMERGLIVERTRLALQHKRSKGERLGTTPLGFMTPEPGAPMQPVPEELEAVRLILKRRRRGGKRASFRAIARELTEAGLRTKRGGEWHASTVRHVWERRQQYAELLRSLEGLEAAS